MSETHPRAGRLAGKCCLVTGAASGLGLAMAKSFAGEGATVAIADIDKARGEAAAAALPGAFFLALDVTQEPSWLDALAQAVARMGRLDVLVNNAGVAVWGSIEETSLDQFRFMHAVNVEGTFLGCKHAIPRLRASGGGSIINISSVAGIAASPMLAAYSATKGAVRLLTKSVALDLARRGDAIRCNSIHPIFFNTPMLESLAGVARDAEKLKSRLAASVPMGRFGEPEEVASMAVYLASDESRFVTGAELVIDGGFTAG